MIRCFLGLVVWALLAVCADARPIHGSPTALGPCGLDPFAVADGCAGTIGTTGAFQDKTWLTTASQSGQTTTLPTHPQAYYIPCVDYACGPDTSVPYIDPANSAQGTGTIAGQVMTITAMTAQNAGYVGTFAIGQTVDSHDATHGRLPAGLVIDGSASGGQLCGGSTCTGSGGAGTYHLSGTATLTSSSISAGLPWTCSWEPTSSASNNIAQGPLVVCGNNSGSEPITGDHWNMGAINGHDATFLLVSNFLDTGVHVWSNLNFDCNSTTGGQCKDITGNPVLIQINEQSSSPSITYSRILFDGEFFTQFSRVFGIQNKNAAASCTITYRYIVWRNLGGRPIQSQNACSVDRKFYYVNGLVLSGFDHGEVDDNVGSGVVPSIDDEYFTYTVPNYTIAGMDITAPFWIGPGQQNGGYISGNVTIAHFTEVNNKATAGYNQQGYVNPSGATPSGYAVFGLNATVGGALLVTDGFVDPTGAFVCAQQNRATPTTLLADVASTSGNNVFLTSSDYVNGGSIISGAFQIGWWLINTNGSLGFSPAHLTAQTSGSPGQTGTYTFDGPPQTVGSNNTWQTWANVGTFSIGTLTNLKDRSQVTIPYLSPTATLNDGQCNGANTIP